MRLSKAKIRIGKVVDPLRPLSQVGGRQATSVLRASRIPLFHAGQSVVAGQDFMKTAIAASCVIACVTAITASEAVAQNKLSAMVFLQGTCKKLVVQGKIRTPDCAGKLLNSEYSDGRLGFYFVTSEGMALTFSTRGKEQVKSDPDTAIVPVDSVLVGWKGKTDRVQAVGTCKFTNPYKGVPAPIECTADTAAGRYEGMFLSDGSKPDDKTFN